MKPTENFVALAARQGIPIPSSLEIQLAKIRFVEDLRAFLNDVEAAETAAATLVDTELHSAAVRRIERLGFGPADYSTSKQIMLGVIFSPEVLAQIEVSESDQGPSAFRMAA